MQQNTMLYTLCIRTLNLSKSEMSLMHADKLARRRAKYSSEEHVELLLTIRIKTLGSLPP